MFGNDDKYWVKLIESTNACLSDHKEAFNFHMLVPKNPRISLIQGLRAPFGEAKSHCNKSLNRAGIIDIPARPVMPSQQPDALTVPGLTGLTGLIDRPVFHTIPWCTHA
ncbi:hypothetical protein HYE68_004086 [Fusarium pseudograminearum]|nr:hypothetical protein HYE68_004086 [Fusarium pseudograminearum]